MFFHPIKILFSVGFIALALTSQTYIFEHDDTGATIDYVKNSGICETTPGVNQYSGYLTVGGSLILVPCPKRKLANIRE